MPVCGKKQVAPNGASVDHYTNVANRKSQKGQRIINSYETQEINKSKPLIKALWAEGPTCL